MKNRNKLKNGRNKRISLSMKGGNGGYINPTSYHHPAQPDSGLDVGRGSKYVQDRRAVRPWIIAILIIILVFGLLELPIGTKPNIEIIGDSGQASPSQINSYQSASEHIISSSITNRTKLTLNQSSLENRLKSQFPVIKTANVSYSLFNYTPTIKLTLQSPVLQLVTSSGNFLIDSSGEAIGRASNGGAAKNLPVVLDRDNVTAESGKRILPADYVNFVTGIIGQLSANGVNVSKLTLLPREAEVDAGFTGVNYIAKFNLEGGYKEQSGMYVAVSRYLSKKGITPIAYIDLRVPGRAYYK